MRDLGVANVFQSQQKALERIQLSGFFTVGANPYAEFVRNNFSFDDQFRWVKGRHSIAIGGLVERTRVDVYNLARQNGFYTFTNDITNYAIASLMLGKLRTYAQGAGEFRNDRVSIVSLFVQASFK